MTRWKRCIGQGVGEGYGNSMSFPHQPTVPKSPGVPWKLSEPILLGFYEGSITQAWWIKLSAIGSWFLLQALFPSWRLVWVLGLNWRVFLFQETSPHSPVTSKPRLINITQDISITLFTYEIPRVLESAPETGEKPKYVSLSINHNITASLIKDLEPGRA